MSSGLTEFSDTYMLHVSLREPLNPNMTLSGSISQYIPQRLIMIRYYTLPVHYARYCNSLAYKVPAVPRCHTVGPES